jgi:hypothetical protein
MLLLEHHQKVVITCLTSRKAKEEVKAIRLIQVLAINSEGVVAMFEPTNFTLVGKANFCTDCLLQEAVNERLRAQENFELNDFVRTL